MATNEIRTGDALYLSVGSKKFQIRSNTGLEINPPGFKISSNTESITGQNIPIKKMNNNLGTLGITVSFSNVDAELKYLQDWRDSGDSRTTVLTLKNSVVYSFDGYITGDLSFDSNEGNCTLELCFPILEQYIAE